MELIILKTIEWKVYVATPMIFLQHVSPQHACSVWKLNCIVANYHDTLNDVCRSLLPPTCRHSKEISRIIEISK